MIIAASSAQADLIAREKEIPRSHWRRARHEVDLAGVSVDRVLTADPVTVWESAGNAVEAQQTVELYGRLRLMENRENRKAEIVPTP